MVRDVFCKNCDTKLGWMYVSVTGNSLFGGHLTYSPGSLDL